MGDVPLRLHRKLGEGGLLSPIGRPAVLRRLLAANPSAEVARAKAAKDAVAKLDASSVADVAGELVPAILEIGAPVDPPISMLLAPDDPPSMPSARAAAPTPTHRKNKLHSHQRASASMTMALLHGRLTRGFLILFALLAVAAVAIFGARERVGSARG